jgi:hypothetical protein
MDIRGWRKVARDRDAWRIDPEGGQRLVLTVKSVSQKKDI